MHASSLSDRRLPALTLPRPILNVIDKRVGKAVTCFFFLFFFLLPLCRLKPPSCSWQKPSLASGVCTSHSCSVTRLYFRTIIVSV